MHSMICAKSEWMIFIAEEEKKAPLFLRNDFSRRKIFYFIMIEKNSITGYFPVKLYV